MNNKKEIVSTHKKNSKKRNIIIAVILIILTASLIIVFLTCNKKDNKKKEDNANIKNDSKEVYQPYKMSSNGIENFDLAFLKLENEKKNTLYSPLSIKYSLAMLSEGANGDSKKQINELIGDYKYKKYINTENMSFANAMFIRESFKDNIKKSYADNLSNKYDASIIYDSFATANNLNKWVNDKTLGLIDNLFDDATVSGNDFFLVNALAINMEWNKLIQTTTAQNDRYFVSYSHENYSTYIPVLGESEYHTMSFNNNINAKSVEIGASINNYDIVKELGEENIRNTISKEYEEWLAEEACGPKESQEDVDTYVDNFIKDLNQNYKKKKSSTDFLMYNDDNIKVFAKDLKTYNQTTLQYVGIMPKNEELDSYVKNIKNTDLNDIIKNLKTIDNNNFTEGKITKITGYLPLFKYDYQLKLKADLEKIGITNVFDKKKADLSNITSQKGTYINTAEHKANIEFSNEGIKAAAATQVGGSGAATCAFEHLYEVPVEEIDLTFDKPYMYIIRDKNTSEIWFIGTVYEPIRQ